MRVLRSHSGVKVAAPKLNSGNVMNRSVYNKQWNSRRKLKWVSWGINKMRRVIFYLARQANTQPIKSYNMCTHSEIRRNAFFKNYFTLLTIIQQQLKFVSTVVDVRALSNRYVSYWQMFIQAYEINVWKLLLEFEQITRWKINETGITPHSHVFWRIPITKCTQFSSAWNDSF